MPIVRANESFPARPVVMLIYGVPGVGKTSLSVTSENPVLVDCDRGADRAVLRKDTLVCSCWEDIINEKETFKNYKPRRVLTTSLLTTPSALTTLPKRTS